MQSVVMQSSSPRIKEVEPPVANALATHPFTSGMPPQEVSILAENAMRVVYPAGQMIFREGDPANRFYLIESGEVAIESHANPMDTIRIQTIKAGDVLGWSWLFPPYTWHFDARTLEPTTAIFLYATRIRQACEDRPEIGYDLMQRIAAVVIKRLQDTRKQLANALSCLEAAGGAKHNS
ncbi:MAG TPA: cyclic nucleotide-binding domain-containing protein [Verrucomicrobiae bacterium]